MVGDRTGGRRKQEASKRKSKAWRRRHAGRALTGQEAPKVSKVLQILGRCCPDLRKWLALNLAIMTVSMMVLWSGARGGNGWLSLSALSRAMPLGIPEKMRSKRLYRFLANKWLEGSVMTPLLMRLVMGDNPPKWIPIVVDQTTLRGVQVLMAGVRLCGRTLPVAFTCFTYETLHKSQNSLESALLGLIAASLPSGCKPLYVMDRGYARVQLLRELKEMGIPFLIRGKKNVTIRVGQQKLSIGRLHYRMRRPIRYSHVLYQATRREPIDVVVFHEPAFKEPWYLLVPPDSEELLPTEQVVSLYRERMWVELTFRDWKTHLGVRGLRLDVDPHLRMERLLLALTTAYVLVVMLGACPRAARVRCDCEVLRSQPRHGTCKRLSALSIGILMLSLQRFARLARITLMEILDGIRRGLGAWNIARSKDWFSPMGKLHGL